MTMQITTDPLTADAFAPFGDLLDCAGDPDKLINQGLCGRYHDRATLDFAEGPRRDQPVQGRIAQPALQAGHDGTAPAGSQAFVPMSMIPSW